MRAGIAALPDGTYTNEAWTDGFDEPIVLRCTVVVSGDELTVDWAGSSPQSLRGINLVLNYTHAYTTFTVRSGITPQGSPEQRLALFRSHRTPRAPREPRRSRA